MRLSAETEQMEGSACRALWIIFGHLSRPRSRSVSTVQYVAEACHRWEDKSAIEDQIEYVVLRFEPMSFFLWPRELSRPVQQEGRQ